MVVVDDEEVSVMVDEVVVLEIEVEVVVVEVVDDVDSGVMKVVVSTACRAIVVVSPLKIFTGFSPVKPM